MDRENGCRYLIIADNGRGMDEKQMQKGMYLGITRSRDEEELGKFGVGLKISSMSQADEVLVISQPENTDSPVVRRISYSHIMKTQSLRLLRKTGRDILHYEDVESLGCRKLVLWYFGKNGRGRQYTHRLKEYRQAFEKEREELKHLAVTFRRYLSGKTKSERN